MDILNKYMCGCESVYILKIKMQICRATLAVTCCKWPGYAATVKLRPRNPHTYIQHPAQRPHRGRSNRYGFLDKANSLEPSHSTTRIHETNKNK